MSITGLVNELAEIKNELKRRRKEMVEECLTCRFYPTIFSILHNLMFTDIIYLLVINLFGLY